MKEVGTVTWLGRRPCAESFDHPDKAERRAKDLREHLLDPAYRDSVRVIYPSQKENCRKISKISVVAHKLNLEDR